MANWFYDTFLPSLFEQAGREQKWLSWKQTAICTRYMDEHTVNIQQYQGHVQRHSYYTTDWNGRKVTLNYSKLNGCGTIQFGANEAEQIEAKAASEKRAQDREDRRLQRLLQRRPEEFAEQLQKLKADLQEYEQFMEQDREENDAESLEYDAWVYQNTKNSVERMERVMKAAG